MDTGDLSTCPGSSLHIRERQEVTSRQIFLLSGNILLSTLTVGKFYCLASSYCQYWKFYCQATSGQICQYFAVCIKGFTVQPHLTVITLSFTVWPHLTVSMLWVCVLEAVNTGLGWLVSSYCQSSATDCNQPLTSRHWVIVFPLHSSLSKSGHLQCQLTLSYHF